jgi:hypothetical protein
MVPFALWPHCRSNANSEKGNTKLMDSLAELIGVLSQDPHVRSGRHPIKKLAGLRPGEGQWRIRWREYRLR